MPSSDQVKTALLTEHFRYTPLTLLDDIINTVNELVFQAVNEIEDSLLNTDSDTLGFARSPDADAVARAEIEAGIVQLESLLNATIDKNFDKLEIYTLRNLLTVSNASEDDGLEDWIMLDHYKGLEQPRQAHSAVDDSTMDALTALRKKVHETDKLHRALKAEVARNEALLAKLQPLRIDAQRATQPADPTEPEPPSFSFLSSTPAASELDVFAKRDTLPLSQNTRFTISQLGALQRALAELRPHLESVPQPGPDGDDERTRRAYLESHTRQAVDRGGVKAAQHAEGRTVTAEEVAALESIAGALAE